MLDGSPNYAPEGRPIPILWGSGAEALMKAQMSPPSTGAKAVIQGGKIIISIDVDALPIILSGSIAAGDLMSGYLYKVTDAEAFAKEVCSELNDENEIGTTEVHKMFDRAMMRAIDNGGEGVEEVDEDGFEEEASRLQKTARGI